MNLILSGRGVDLDESLREYATEKLTRVERFFDRIMKMEVELIPSRNGRKPHLAEVTVRAPGETFRAHGEGVDLFSAIDKAADRLEAQMRKIKERRRNHPHREPKAATVIDDKEEGDAQEIARFAQQAGKPLDPEEAALELESRGWNFLLFTNAETMRAAVIYRRADGALAVIDHEG